MERHFKGHRDIVTCVDFNPNMKQIGRSQLSLFTITSEDHPSLIETLSILKFMYLFFFLRSEIIFYAFLQSDWLHERSV